MAGMRVVRIVFGVAVACAACTTFSEGIPSETTDAGTGADGGPGSTKDAEPNEATTGERDAGDAKQGTAAEYFQLVKSDGPQAYWRMGDVAGSTAAQDSIADNDALLSPTAQPVFGNPGLFPGTGSLTFNGQTYSYSYVTGTLPIDNVALTLEAWVRLDSPADSEYRHIAFAGSQSLSYGIYVHDTAGFGVSRISSQPSATKTFRQTNASPSTNTWHHVVATWDGAALTLYVDDEIAMNGTTEAASDPTVSLLYLGAKSSSTPSLPSGARLAEVAVYATALAPDRVHAHYVLGRP